MKIKLRSLALIILATLVTYGAWLSLRARSKLVTLNVRNAELRNVVREIEWQTWETIHIATGIRGQVTLNVTKMPVEDVLRIVGQQTASHSVTVYPIYSSRASLRQFEKVVRGELPGVTDGWRSWHGAGHADFGNFANNLRDQNELVNARFQGKDAAFAALALSRFSRAQVVAEDGTAGSVTLNLSGVTVPDAVAQVARQVNRKWTAFYVLSPGLIGMPVSTAGDRDLNTINFGYGLLPGDGTNSDAEFQARLATLSPAESNRLAQLRRTSDALRAMPADRRREVIQNAMNNPGLQDKVRDAVMGRINAGLRNATPDQRVQASRALTAMQKN